MNAELFSRQQIAKRILKRTVIAAASLVAGILFGPAAIRGGYSITTKKSDIESLKQRYWALVAVQSLRQIEVSDWLRIRGISMDPGIRDEAVEHAPYLIYLYGMICWQWEDLFRYWSRPSIQRTPQFLLSDEGFVNSAPAPGGLGVGLYPQ